MIHTINKHLLLEARAIDRRQDAISKGIVPINGSNWNADRKNPKKINQMLNLAKKSKTIDGEITDRHNISPFKEYGGIINKNNIDMDRIGTRKSVSSVNTNDDTFHKHPAISLKNSRAAEATKHFKNLPISTPSGKPDKTFSKIFSTGDYGSNSISASLSPNNKSNEYIISPNTKSNTISKLSTTILPDDTAKHKLTYVSNKAKKFYDLNGNLINGANDYAPTKKKLFIKDKVISDKINALKTLKTTERKAFHNKALDINNMGFSGEKLLAQTYKREGLNALRKSQPSLHNTSYLNDYNKSSDFANTANTRYKNNNQINTNSRIIDTVGKMNNVDTFSNDIRNEAIKKRNELEKEVLPEYGYTSKKS